MQSESQTKSQPEKREVVETSLKPAYPLISNQPDRFGALSEAFLFVEEKRLFEYLGKLKFYSIIAVILLALPIIGHVATRLNSHDPTAGIVLDVAKILLVYVLIGSVAALSGFFLYRHKIMELLAQLEDLAYFGDDMARFYMPYLRSEMKDFNEKIRKYEQGPATPSSIDIMKDVWPVVSMLLKHDTDIIKWGKVGMKAYKALSVFFKGHPNSQSETT
jgi:hypothetical protein